MTDSPTNSATGCTHEPDTGHVLMTPADCNCRQRDTGVSCAICDGGLGVCKLCGAAEIELDIPCKGYVWYTNQREYTVETCIAGTGTLYGQRVVVYRDRRTGDKYGTALSEWFLRMARGERLPEKD